jgi:hypothetical protein
MAPIRGSCGSRIYRRLLMQLFVIEQLRIVLDDIRLPIMIH